MSRGWLGSRPPPLHLPGHYPVSTLEEYPALDALEAHQAHRLHHLMTQAGLTVSQVWWHYFSLGGNTGVLEIDAYLHQALHLSRLDRELLDHAAQELRDDQAG